MVHMVDKRAKITHFPPVNLIFFLEEAGHRREVPGNVMIHIPITCYSYSLEQTRWRRNAGRALEGEHIPMSGQSFILLLLPIISGSSEHFQGPLLFSFILGKSSKSYVLDMHICKKLCSCVIYFHPRNYENPQMSSPHSSTLGKV